MMEKFAESMLRSVLKDAFSQPWMTLDNLVDAIDHDVSLSSIGGDVISGYAGCVKGMNPFITSMAGSYIEKISVKYGSVTNLVLVYLEQDYPTYFSIIKSHEKGEVWLDRQVDEILSGLEMKK